MRTALLVFAGLAALAYGLVTRMPADVLAHSAETNISGLNISGTSGTALDGRVTGLVYKGFPLQGIEWHIKPWTLLLGALEADIHVGTDLGGMETHIKRSLFGGGLALTDIQGGATLGWLAKHAGYAFLPVSGRLKLDLSHVTLASNGQIKSASGTATITDIHWQLMHPPAFLGRISAEISTESSTGTTMLRITESKGPLIVKGKAELNADNTYWLNIRLRPRDGAKPRVKQLISELGNADANGWYRIQTRGQL